MIYGWNGMGFESQISGVESDCSNHCASAVIYVFFCEICLFDHTWVFTVCNLHQSSIIICQ